MPEQSGIFYTDKGKGFPVLLIHGFCETHAIWDSFSAELSKDFRVLCPDLPGFGKSDLLPGNFSITDVASKISAWLKDLQIETCIPIGHSLGGYVILALAEQHPDLLQAFGLFHSTAYPDTEERKLSRNKVMEFVSNHGVQPFVESFIPPLFHDQSNIHIPRIVRLASQTSPETLIAYVQAMRDRPDRTSVLQHFKKSVLFLAGKEDKGITLESVKKQADLAIEVTFHALSGIAHMGMFENGPQTLTLVQDFLSAIARK